MDTRLDSVAKAIAQETTRRQAMRRLGGSLVGGVLAGLGLGGGAVRAQATPVCATCQQCISQFRGTCTADCAQQFTPELCPTACCEGALTTCTLLGKCTSDCAITCPQG